MESRASIGVFLSMMLVAGCAMTATTAQMQNLETESSQVPMGYAKSALESGACVELGEHRLQGRAGMTISSDLKMLADEIDSTVTYNGGNSYIIHSWQWVLIDNAGSTAPLVEITVMNCGESPTIIESQEPLET